ncbi:MAG TPA: transglycosylase domain-containing protein, partial [Egibacteraceae bacterium]|nr:transglycosylase domain-containing protein [Egibacteraceae bacterium]
MSLGSLQRLRPPVRRPEAAEDDGPPALEFALRVGALALAGLVGFGVVVLLLAVLGGTAVRSATGAVAIDLAVPDDAALPALDQRSIVYAADGSVLAVLHDEVDRRVVPLAQIPQHVRQAVLTAEDRKFYTHDGYDVEGIGRAFVANARARGITQGGSTITQQLAKANFVGGDQTVRRKLDELLHAIALERRFTKEELLERYLNQVYFGSGAYGIAAAAEEFFRTTPEQLTVEQAALLAGTIRAPSALDPRTNPDAALVRRNQIIAGMAAAGHLPADEVAPRQAVPLVVADHVPKDSTEPYFVEAVKDEFFRNPAFGEERQDRIERLFNGGLAIHTTLDPRLQDIAAEVVARQFPDPNGPTGAIAAVDPRNGRILALHGGSDFHQSQFDIARLGRRHPGSAFKPFVYASALEQGFPLTTRLQGASPAYFANVPGWSREDGGVRNYGNSSYGRLDMREALVRSVNTAAAQLMLMVGPDKVLDLAGRMGINVDAMTEGLVNPSIALGSPQRGVTPLEMAAAYGTFANDGNYAAPHVIDRVDDASGKEVYRVEVRPQRAVDAAVAEALVGMMKDVVRRGTATRARLTGWEAMGKTGTTQNSYDAWFVGGVPVLSTAVWMGHVGENIPMRGMTGGSVPASMWQSFMSRALEGVEPVPFVHSGGSLSQIASAAEVPVPDVRRMDEAQAMAVLAEAKLAGQVQQVSARTPQGLVVWQSPRQGAAAAPGTTVTIGVSSGRGSEPDRRRPRESSGQQPSPPSSPPPPPAPAAPPPAAPPAEAPRRVAEQRVPGEAAATTAATAAGRMTPGAAAPGTTVTIGVS